MRVLITGVTAPSGRAVARMLLAAGHEVVGVDTRRHRYLDPRVEVSDGAASVMAGCDCVIHLAAGPVGDVAGAAREAGARLVVPVPAGRDVADIVCEDALVVRTAPVAGRRVDRRVLGMLLNTAGPQDFQLLHSDDLERFLVSAVESRSSGVVELAAPGTVSGDEIRHILQANRARRRSSARPPLLDPVAAHEEWGFRCGWTTREVVEDIARGLPGRRRDLRARLGAIPLPTHVIPSRATTSDGHGLHNAAPDGLEGEFDDRVDDRIPVHTATNTSEALPGPMTPLTIDLQAGAIRLGNEAMGRMLALQGIALEHWVSRVTSVLGHSFDINASIGLLAADNMPGWDEETIRRDVYGAIPAEVPLQPEGRPPMPTGPAGRLGTLRATGRVLATALRYRSTAELIHAAARAESLSRSAIGALTDEQLHARMLLWRDRLDQAWQVASIGVMMTGAATSVHRGEVRIDPHRLESAKPVLAVERLAALCRQDAGLHEVARRGDVAAAREKSRAFAAALDEELAEVGHRGPGECELLNPTFADRPELLVTAAARAADLPAPHRAPVSAPAGRAAALAVGATVYRERARDAVVRITGCLRMATRERAARLIRAGALDERDDSAYLTLDEILWAPADLRDRVARRRAERARLQDIRMPDLVVGHWEPASAPGALAVGETLIGLGVSPGTVEGTVKRVLTLDDDIDPGDILVAAVTDTGHTAMFAYAAAVVTDIGGAASHAAIVAREFDIPCIVDTKTASTALSDGQRIRVDGTTGTITLLSPE
ncbi:phosphohistidine swiveling domain-containing protein [Nocardia transvalensis]|uniref:Phosphohistidine swiveling domain-containing protein n=1 Tax=Nocardia transvalensis TaxID=37333 RepID=A0A7W9UNA3_9NOCA|nr:PEP-utilizing enzyme [Nocardia transvalensis]MBB5918630.1 phosphohistidine swiveling domain-containing protein [Nocardia transvalensis]